MPSLFGNTGSEAGSDLVGLPQTTKSGIYYEIDALNYREQWIPGANRTEVTVRVPGDQAWDFVTDMVGRAYIGDGILRRDIPEQNPFDPQQYCTKVEQVDQGGGEETFEEIEEVPEPVDPEVDPPAEPARTLFLGESGPTADASNGWPLPRWIRYRVTFEGLPYYCRTDEEVDDLGSGNLQARELLRYVVRTRRPQAREQQIPGGAFKLVDDAVPANRTPLMQTAFKVIMFADVQYVWHRVPVANLPLAIWDGALGKINQDAFDVLTGGYNFAAETLLFAGYDDTNRYFDANEDWVCDVVLSWRYNKITWNKFLNNQAVAVAVSLDGTSGGGKPYEVTSFADLLTVTP